MREASMTEGRPDRWLCQASGVREPSVPRCPIKVRLSFCSGAQGGRDIFPLHLVAVRSQKVLCHSFPWRDAAAGLRSPSGRASGAVIHLLLPSTLDSGVILCIRVHVL